MSFGLAPGCDAAYFRITADLFTRCFFALGTLALLSMAGGRLDGFAATRRYPAQFYSPRPVCFSTQR
jgi:hypothetical protein